MNDKLKELTEEMFTDKWMKQFNKLCVEDRKKVLEVIVNNVMSDALLRVSTRSMIEGMYYQGESLYDKYAKRMDNIPKNSAEWNELAEKLLSELRMMHLKYIQSCWDGDKEDEIEKSNKK